MDSNPCDYLGKEVVGYVINLPLSEENQKKIGEIQQKVADAFPGLLWTPQGNQLHITIMDWVAPLVDYGIDKERLFKQNFDHYDALLGDIIKNYRVFSIRFNKLIAFKNTILVVGQDNGTINGVRKTFLEKADLDPRTKRPAGHIHTTIARYKKVENLEKINNFLNSIRINFTQEVKSLRLVKELKVPMMDFEIIKEYKLR